MHSIQHHLYIIYMKSSWSYPYVQHEKQKTVVISRNYNTFMVLSKMRCLARSVSYLSLIVTVDG
jgi:hypothetical protein